jgi:hypothetical protein
MRIVSSFDVSNIEARPYKAGRTVTAESAATETERAVPAASRALATQWDVLFIQTHALMQGGRNASPTLVAQQIGQLWPARSDPAAATEAYRSAALPIIEAAHAFYSRV